MDMQGTGPTVTDKNLLWTGGWDSTFRLLQATVCDGATVQPHYVVDFNRRGLRCEMQAMASIKEAVAARFPEARPRILPTLLYERCEIPVNEAIAASHQALLKQSYLGWQYVWLASLAGWASIPQLELAVHRDDLAHGFLSKIVSRGPDGSFAVSENAPSDAATLFRHFAFPILDMTKLGMAEVSARHGFSNVLELTWFCDNPDRHLRPCGACGPCRYTIDEGLARRVPASKRARSKVASLLAPVRQRLPRMLGGKARRTRRIATQR